MPNITIYENVTFTVGGQNPQSKTVQVAFSVDPVTSLGSATASFTYTGTNGGVDTITAALPAFNYTSNAASVAWQPAPALLNTSDVIQAGVIHNGGSRGFNITSAVAFLYTLTVPSLYYDVSGSANPSNSAFPFTIPGFPPSRNDVAANITPGLFIHLTSQGAYAGPPDVPLQNSTGTIKDGASDFKVVMTGSFVVKQAGNLTISFPYVNDSVLLSIGNGASLVSGSLFNPYGQTHGPYTGYPILLAANGSTSDNYYHSPSPYTTVINFPTPGVYPFEVDYNNSFGNAGCLEISFNGSNVVPPVSLLPAPAQPAPGNQNLVLTPTGGATNLKIQGQTVTLSLALNNVKFPTQPYMPIMEGSTGQVYIYNDPLNPTFSFQSYYGNTPDGPSATADDFVLVGNNTAWQGQVALQWNSVLNKFQLYYNGSQSLAPNQLFAPNVQATTLTITQEDVAWFNPTGPAYDTFQATSSGGGKLANIPVYYLLNPNYPAGGALQVSPTTVVTGTPPAPGPITPIRRATWGSGVGSGLSGPGANTPGSVITIFGEGRGLAFPPSLKVGGQVILAGFINPFPKGSGITGQSGSSQAGPSEPYNISGTYVVNQITTAVVGGSEVCPVFTVTAPANGGATRSYDWGSSVNPPDGGWTFQPVIPPGASSTTFTVTLARPLPPIQNNTIMNVQFSGTQPSNVTVTPNLATINSIPGWLVSYSVTATFAPQAVSTTTTMTFTFVAPSITFLGTLGTAIDQFTTLTNYTFPGPAPSATITLQAQGSGSAQPYNISLTETNGGTPVLTALIGATTVLTATWVSYNNNFSNTVFYVTPKSTGVRVALGTVAAGSATITSIGGGKYQAVFQLTVSTSTYYNTDTYQFSYVGTCTDNSTVSYSDTNYYSSNNPAPPSGGGGGGGGGGGCFTGNVEFMTPSGALRFDECPSVVIIQNETGIHTADLIVHEGTWNMLNMGDDKLVTLDHVIKRSPWDSASPTWDAATRIFSPALYVRKEYEGKVYNLHVRSDNPEDQHYILGNGVVAHNIKVAIVG